MTTVYRSVKWGEALLVEASKFRGGLSRAVENIRAEVGPHIGTRNTFAKLYEVEDPEQLTPQDRYRAWLLLAALGSHPDLWGLPFDVVPRAIDPYKLMAELRGGRTHPLEYSSSNPPRKIARPLSDVWPQRWPDDKRDSDESVTGSQHRTLLVAA